MKALSMAATCFEEPGHPGFGHLGQSGSAPDAPAFIQMIDDIDRFGLAQFRIEPSSTASFGKFILTAPTTKKADTSLAINLANDEIALARLILEWALGIDLRYSGQVGSVHEALLTLWLNDDGELQPIRHPQSIRLRLSQDTTDSSKAMKTTSHCKTKSYT